MKKSTRGFVVERRHSKKTPLWSATELSAAEPQRKSTALREADELFRPKTPAAAQEPMGPTVRVLPDLSEQPVLEAREPAARLAAAATPRRPRGRPRKIVDATAAAPDLWSFSQAAGTSPPAAIAASDTTTPANDHKGSSASQQADDIAHDATPAPEALIRAQTPDEIIAAVRNKVDHRANRKRRFRTAAELPVGQRWKRRLHPAAW